MQCNEGMMDEDFNEPIMNGREIKEEVFEHSGDAINLYMREIQKARLLSAEEERELAVKIALGDMAAREKMIVSNLRLVVKIAKGYIYRGLPLLDLVEEGNLGLIKAVERFDPARECRFSTYATWWIRQSVERAVMNQSRTVRLPVHVTEEIIKVQRVSHEFRKRKNREPSAREVADTLQVEESQVHRLMGLLTHAHSIDQPMGEHKNHPLHETIEDTTSISARERYEALNTFDLVSKYLETFSDTERTILTLRFGLNDQEPQTLETIGQSFGITRERIRQIEARALRKLRDLMKASDGTMAYC
jgi:RNA polymerase primary sigma factor